MSILPSRDQFIRIIDLTLACMGLELANLYFMCERFHTTWYN